MIKISKIFGDFVPRDFSLCQGLLPTIRHFENRRGEGPGDEVGLRSKFECLNRPLAATSSRDVIFIKLWATTLRMPEMEKAYRKYHNGQV